jgi:acetyltransferase
MRREPGLGAFILLGVGGVWVEVMDDVAIRPTPVGPQEVTAMLRELRARPLLDGGRGTDPLNLEALADIVVALSRLASEHPEVSEVDLNPVLIRHDGAIAVDRHVVCAPPSPGRIDRATVARR